MKSKGYERTARLRLPFALEIQRAFTANLTRIGMPVAPPIYQPVEVQLFYKGEDRNHAVFEGPNDKLVFLAFTKDGEQCVLTMTCVMLLMSKIDLFIKNIEEEEAQYSASTTPDDVKRLERLRRRKDELHTSRKNYNSWLQMLTPFELRPGTEKVFDGVSVKICRDKATEGRYSHQQVILLSITTSYQQEEQENG